MQRSTRWKAGTATICATLLLFGFVDVEATSPDLGTALDCACWAGQGQCDTKPAFMMKHCAASCAKKQACERCLEEEPLSLKRIVELQQRLENQGESAKENDFNGKRIEELPTDLDRQCQVVNAAEATRFDEQERVHQKYVAELQAELEKQKQLATDGNATCEKQDSLSKQHIEELQRKLAKEMLEVEKEAVARCEEKEHLNGSVISELRKEVLKQKNLVQRGNATISQLTAIYSKKGDGCQSALALAQKRTADLEAQHDDVANKEDECQASFALAQKRAADLEAQHDDVAKKKDECQAAFALAQKRAADLEAQHDDVAKKGDECQAALALAQKRAADLDAHHDDVAKKGDEFRAEIALAQKRTAELQAQHDDVVVKLQARIKDLETQLAHRDQAISQPSTKLPGLGVDENVGSPKEQANDLGGTTSTTTASQQRSKVDLPHTDRDHNETFGAILEQIAKLEHDQARQNSTIVIAHAELEDRIESRTQTIFERIRALEEFMADVRSDKIAAIRSHPPQRAVREDAQPGIDHPKSDGGGIPAWTSSLSASELLANASSHAMDFDYGVVQPIIEQSWSMTAVGFTRINGTLTSLYQYALDLAPQVWMIIARFSEHSGALFRQAWPAIENRFAHLFDSLRSAANWIGAKTQGTETAARFAHEGKTSMVAVGLAILLALCVVKRFRKYLYHIVISPLRFVFFVCLTFPIRVIFYFCRRLLRLVCWPARCCSHYFCCCCTRRAKDDEGGKPVVANMGLDNNFYYDEQKGKWRERGKEHLEKDDVPPPPPPSVGMLSTAANAQEAVKDPNTMDSLMAPPNPYAKGMLGNRSGMPPMPARAAMPVNATTSAFTTPAKSAFPAPKTAFPATESPAPVRYDLSPRVAPVQSRSEDIRLANLF